jgi:hypothetical protein
MLLTAPLWLLALVPWAAVTLWLLWGARRREWVPFLPLWQGSAGKKRHKRSLEPPPIALAALILAMLLAILAAARPAFRLRGAGGRLKVLVDRGVTMSAFANGHPRYVELAATLDRLLHGRWAGRIEIIDVISGQSRSTSADRWLADVTAMPRTAIDTSSLVRSAVARELASGEDPVVLLSDHPAGANDARFAQLSPRRPLSNVGIVGLSARETPSVQVMVTIRNDSARTSAELRVQESARRIDLPSAGQEAHYFVDVPTLGDSVEVSLAAADELEADNAAWLVREVLPARPEIRSSLPDAVRRVIDVYQRARPAREASPTIAIVNRVSDLPSGDPGIVVESALTGPAIAGELKVTSHPVTAIIDWFAATRGAKLAPSRAGWTPLVTVGGHPLVAVREAPARQIWIGFDSPDWPRSADFVVFWTNALDWLRGRGAGDLISHAVAPLPPGWKPTTPQPPGVQVNAWPGVYSRDNGETIATNALNVPIEPVLPDASALPRALLTASAGRALSPWLLLAALACGALAALTWDRRDRIRRELPVESALP